MRAGLRYLAGQPILLTAYLADLTAMAFGMPVAVFPQLSQQAFGDPPGGGPAIGVLSAALSLGALAAGCCAGAFTRVRRHGVMVTAAVCGWGLAVAGAGLARSLWSAAACLLLSGGALTVLSVFRKTLLQAAAVDAMRGRLQGVDTVVGAGGPRLAGILHGTAAATWGTSWSITGGGLLTAAVMVALVLAVPAFWRYSPVGA
ncbi:hypothetical protein GCM10009665_71830 [Kitasatospora nipponensis]|uniref:Major facilitator superfamily (MFS) profile domain-containing protein n=1 Tax=Kitasatospora nipponensis TaxID=258049 RepID=A0ABP4HSB2_9ACTN